NLGRDVIYDNEISDSDIDNSNNENSNSEVSELDNNYYQENEEQHIIHNWF
ncbi:45_t:CDS:1, partial [Funneliformis caledonium]